MTGDTNNDIRRRAAESLGTVFPHVPDREKAWDDLHRLTGDSDSYVRGRAAESLGTVFPHVPDREKAWDDLHRLTGDTNNDIRGRAAESLGTVFPLVPDKKMAWEDLIRLIGDTNSDIRGRAAESLGTVFPHVPDREKAWDDLHRLTGDSDSYVRVFANHSLGRASIFNATEAESEEGFKKDLENALAHFEKATKEEIYRNPAKFCHLFYRSFFTLTFVQKSENEVQRCLSVAKTLTKGSESKEKLLEVMENLANALREAQNTRERDLNTMRGNLNTYRRYCDRAAELLMKMEEKTPGVTKTIKRGMPIIEERIKAIVDDIQRKANIACQQSRGLPTEEIACTVHQKVQRWSISDQEQLTHNVEKLIFVLKSKIPSIPENRPIHEEIEKIIKENDIVKQYESVAVLVALIPTAHIASEKIKEIGEKIDDIQLNVGKIPGMEMGLRRIEDKSNKILENVQKIELSCNRIIRDLEEKGVKLGEADKQELKKLKTLADDLTAANKEQLTDFINELQNLFKDLKIQKEFEKKAPEHKSLIKKTIKGTLYELGTALSAALTAEALLPHVETVMSQIVILSQINPALVAALILIPLIALKERTLK